jgi:hypothetical protein
MTTRHLNQTELALRWGISPRTLEAWRWRGHGPCFLKLGRRVIYRLEDIEAYEAEQRLGSDPNDPTQRAPRQGTHEPAQLRSDTPEPASLRNTTANYYCLCKSSIT